MKSLTKTPLCGTCGQPVRPRLAVCQCGHLELSHEINSKGRRTWCFHYDRTGMCRCRSYAPGGQP
jgi:hypothetical protein